MKTVKVEVPQIQAHTAEVLKSNLTSIRDRIAKACARVHRNPETVRLLPVTKTVDEKRIRLLYEAGCRQFGENKVQEAYHKWEALTDLPDLQWSVIGHLQTNKIKMMARFASEFQALDSLRLAEALDRCLQTEGRRLDVFVQVNTSGESSKHGLPPSDVISFVRQLPAYSSLRVRGLMTLAMLSSTPPRVRQCFILLRTLRNKIWQEVPNGQEILELSMGMSGDFEMAIEEGSSVIRVGQAIFGARSP